MTRTSDLRFRKPSLYPAELRDRTLDALPCDAIPFQRPDAKPVVRFAFVAVMVALAGAALPTGAASAAPSVVPSVCMGEGAKPALDLRPTPPPAETGEFLLGDGSKVRIAGLMWPQVGPGDQELAGNSEQVLAAKSFMERLGALSRTGEVLIAQGSGSIDRWGRASVHVVMAGTLGAELALAAGLATLRPGDVSAPCRRALQAVEAGARDARRGLWASPHAVLDAIKHADILPRQGRYTIVEGRVRGLGETSARVYLNFGTIRSENFSIAIPKGALRRFEASGMRWTSLEGRRVRVRGVVLDRGGPLIEISGPDELERLD